jgi:hypothetical protein
VVDAVNYFSGTLVSSSATITGGSINGTTVGASTASTGAFTTLSSSGATTFTAGTASTSTTTGTAVITGGLGVSGRINAANFDGIVGANTAAAGTFTSLSDSGNLTFTGTGNRITGDFSNATLANRVWFRDATTNNSSTLGVIPNGTSLISSVIAFGGSDPDNTSRIQMRIDGANDAQLRSEKSGTGSYLPMTFYTNGSERIRIDTSGNVGIGTSSVLASTKLDVRGAISAYDGGTQEARLNTDGNIELSKTAGDAFIDFKTSTSEDYDCRIQQESNGLRFLTGGNGSTSERMRITSAGDVGIGTTSPDAKLSIKNPNVSGDQTIFTVIGATTAADLFLLKVNQTTDVMSLGTSFSSGALAFTTASGTERMRIDSSGNLLVGRTDAIAARVCITNTSGNASINCGDAADGTAYGMVQIVRAANQPDNKFHLSFIRSGNKIAGMGFLDNSDTLAIQNTSDNLGAGVGLTNGATSWSTVSDERKKNIIGNVENALTKLADWRTVYFKYKTDEESTPQRVGLIAQDVLATLPEAVTAEEDELKTLQVRYTETVPLLVKAIQEQQAMIETLTTRLNALEGK